MLLFTYVSFVPFVSSSDIAIAIVIAIAIIVYYNVTSRSILVGLPICPAALSSVIPVIFARPTLFEFATTIMSLVSLDLVLLTL